MPSHYEFHERVADPDERGCTVWTGSMSSSGYGLYLVKSVGKRRMAHVVAWNMKFGEVPAGLQLDHLCRNRACVNTDHLEPVTGKVNVNRGYWGMRTKCNRGHDLDGVRRDAWKAGAMVRYCKTCNRENVKKYAAAGGYKNRVRTRKNGVHVEQANACPS